MLKSGALLSNDGKSENSAPDFDTMSQYTTTEIRRAGNGSFVSNASSTQIIRMRRDSVSSKAS